MIRAIFLSLVAMAASPVQAGPLRFDDVARLVFTDANATFAGMRVDSYTPNASLVDTIGKFIGIPGEGTPVRFGPYAMIDGCRPHSCTEKAAIVVDMRSRTIAAVALRNHECRFVVPSESDIAAMVRESRARPVSRCKREPILDIYMVRRSLTTTALQDEREQLDQLHQWGSRVGHDGERVKILLRYASR